MRFNSLPKIAQSDIASRVVEWINTADKSLFLPSFSLHVIAAALRKFNIKVRPDGTPSANGVVRAIEYLESKLQPSTGTSCAGCGTAL